MCIIWPYMQISVIKYCSGRILSKASQKLCLCVLKTHQTFVSFDIDYFVLFFSSSKYVGNFLTLFIYLYKVLNSFDQELLLPRFNKTLEPKSTFQYQNNSFSDTGLCTLKFDIRLVL